MDTSGGVPTTTSTPLGELRVRPTAHGFVADLPEYFCINGRGFGGYTAAIAALAAARYADGKQLRSLRTVFTRSAETGELDLEVLPLMRGRTACGVQVTARQDGEPVVAALAWFASPGLLPAVGARRSPRHVPRPEDCPRLPWLEKVVPFLAGFDARAVDFPLTAEEFADSYHDGGTSIALWAVPRWPDSPGDGLAERLADVMLFDAHLMDAAHRDQPRGTVMTSLDLDVTWHVPAGVGSPDATLLEAEADADGLFANTRGTLSDPDGTIRATGTSQCRMYPPTRSAG
ncbi:acyl-CoA thioesterase domain-containing protein [Embleya sp. NBC_00896]|uniref:acyl-CoA thioesterase domain-containing protein n=1 Tax=Embleya sp. NBC_00896 TaxID=2975961 RepID=UPI003865B4FF|nr:thioesterase family protein [Embleya sp. NBC_00896]